MLDVEHLRSGYHGNQVLRGLSLSVKSGETLCLLGRNGVGKSTTLRSIMGLIPGTTGLVKFRGQNIADLAPWEIAKRGIAYVPEDRRIFASLTVLDNLTIASKSSVGGINWDLERTFSVFPALRKYASNGGAHLSGGEQQMLAIARALMGQPSCILIDEPTEGLSPLITQALIDVFNRISEAGASILLAAQDVGFALAVSHRIAVMERGEIIYEAGQDEARGARKKLEDLISVH